MTITVIAAAYGTVRKGRDVTETVQDRLNKGNDDVKINNRDLGVDPDPGQTKQFGIVYSVNGGTHLARCAVEGDKLELVD